MTQTASFKDKLKTGWAVFKWEFRNCKSQLIVFAILASVFTAVPLVLCLTFGFRASVDDGEFNYGAVLGAVQVFQIVATNAIFALNAVFTVIYTIKIYSYLHNKRKADMYGAMPVTRRTFYVSKTLSAFAISVLPTMFFFSLISIISVCFGQMLIAETAQMYLKVLLGSISCISFYSLLAVCCGTSINAVLLFAAINIAYPIATLFIKGVVNSFLIGFNAELFNSSFVMTALSPLNAYSGKAIVYWLLFTAACFALGTFLVKKRKAESAQTSFAYFLPCYIVKLTVAFIFGMFMGVLFGSLNVFGSLSGIDTGFVSFVFGFIMGSVPAYLIAHIIFYKGIKNILRTTIAYGAMTLAVIVAMALLSFDVIGYNLRLPNEDSIASAGMVDTDECYPYGVESNTALLGEMTDDFTDSESISDIRKIHSGILDRIPRTANERFSSVWLNMVISNLPSRLSNSNGYAVAYKLKNGLTVKRIYPIELSMYPVYTSLSGPDYDTVERIVSSDVYFKNYSASLRANPGQIQSMRVERSGETSVEIKDNAKKIKAIIEAYRMDYAEHGAVSGDDKLAEIRLKMKTSELDGDSLFDSLLYGLAFNRNTYVTDPLYTCQVGKNYTNTISALKEAGIRVE